jgi:pyruvate dehydrogenase E1 component alpha subunit
MTDAERELARTMLREMLLARRFEETCAEQYAAQKIRGFLHLGIGEEASSVGAIRGLDAEDNVVATYREHGHALARGVPPGVLMAEMFGKASGCARGRGGSMHLCDVSRRFWGGFAIVGGGLPIAAGLALADRLRATRRVTAVFFGDGAMEEGEVHETLNLAALWRLPVLFLCENNLYAMGTALARHASNPHLSDKPPTYGIPATKIDGMDALAVQRAVREAADQVRPGGGPRFLELATYRFRAHSMYDADRYRDPAEIAAWKERDPIELLARRLREAGALTDEERDAMEHDAEAIVRAAVAEADVAEAAPVDELERDLYADVPR